MTRRVLAGFFMARGSVHEATGEGDVGAKTTGPHIGKPQNWRNSSTKSRANLVVPASVMGTSRKHRFNSRRYSGLAGKIWVTPRYIVCLVFRIFPGQTDECPSAGVAALEFPGCAVHTYLLIRSRQPLLPKCLKKQSEPQHQPESFSFAKDSRKTSNKSKTGGITMQRAMSIFMVCLLVLATTPGFATSGAHFFHDTTASTSTSGPTKGALVITIDEAGVGQQSISYSVTVNTATATYACINGGGNHPQAA